MKQKFIPFKVSFFAAFFITIGLVFSACNNKFIRNKSKKVEWVTWNYQFKPGGSKDQIYLAKAEIDEYVTKYLLENDVNHSILAINNKYVFYGTNDEPALAVNISLFTRGGDGTRVPAPPPPPPIKTAIPLPFNEKNIQNIFGQFQWK